jgi:hypothetical protein
MLKLILVIILQIIAFAHNPQAPPFAEPRRLNFDEVQRPTGGCMSQKLCGCSDMDMNGLML